MAIIINDNLTTFSPKSLDSRYGPWTSTTQANISVVSSFRYIGLTVGILTGTTTYEGGRYVTVLDGVSEYWYYTGVTDADLILKVFLLLLAVFLLFQE